MKRLWVSLTVVGIFCSQVSFAQTALERFQDSISNSTRSLSHQLAETAKNLELAEARLGKQEVAQRIIRAVTDNIDEKIAKAIASISKQVDEVSQKQLAEIRSFAEITGNTFALRRIRDIEHDVRFQNDPQSVLIELLRTTETRNVKETFENIIAKYEGFPSRMYTDAARRIQRGEPKWYQPFGLTRMLWSYSANARDLGEGLFSAFLGTPFAIGLDVIILPFSIIGHICMFFDDLFTTTPEEATTAELETENSQLKATLETSAKKIQDLEARIKKLENPALNDSKESGAYRK